MDNDWSKERFKKNIYKLLDISRDILMDKIEPIDGVFLIVEIYNAFPDKNISKLDNLFLGFVGIESQADHLPRGVSRKYWNEEALMKKDLEKKRMSIFFMDQIKKDCKRLIDQLEILAFEDNEKKETGKN